MFKTYRARKSHRRGKKAPAFESQTHRNTAEVAFAKARIHIPVKWDIRADKDVEIMVELVETGSDHRQRSATHWS
jgi:hypothetical protein